MTNKKSLPDLEADLLSAKVKTDEQWSEVHELAHQDTLPGPADTQVKLEAAIAGLNAHLTRESSISQRILGEKADRTAKFLVWATIALVAATGALVWATLQLANTEKAAPPARPTIVEPVK